jgi:hypothetical protein
MLTKLDGWVVGKHSALVALLSLLSIVLLTPTHESGFRCWHDGIRQYIAVLFWR